MSSTSASDQRPGKGETLKGGAAMTSQLTPLRPSRLPRVRPRQPACPSQRRPLPVLDRSGRPVVRSPIPPSPFTMTSRPSRWGTLTTLARQGSAPSTRARRRRRRSRRVVVGVRREGRTDGAKGLAGRSGRARSVVTGPNRSRPSRPDPGWAAPTARSAPFGRPRRVSVVVLGSRPLLPFVLRPFESLFV